MARTATNKKSPKKKPKSNQNVVSNRSKRITRSIKRSQEVNSLNKLIALNHLPNIRNQSIIQPEMLTNTVQILQSDSTNHVDSKNCYFTTKKHDVPNTTSSYSNGTSSNEIIEIEDESFNERDEQKSTIKTSTTSNLLGTPVDDNEVIEILDTTVVSNKPIELIVLSDTSDEESISDTMPLVQQSQQPRLREIEKLPITRRPIQERLGSLINSSAPKVKPYQSPLRRIQKPIIGNNIQSKMIWSNDNIVVNDPCGNYTNLQPQWTPLLPQVNTGSTSNRKLRPIIIDGLNIGFAHGSGNFSAKGIDLCVTFFVERKHKDITVFIPQHRQGALGTETHTILTALHKRGFICFTPSRKVDNVRMTCYDDRIMLKYAFDVGGVVVSNDNYRDLYNEGHKFKEIIENRHVMVTFVRDTIIVPDDQYNRKGAIRLLSEILCYPPET